MTQRLRYTGDQATTFKQPPGVGYVEPQGEFDVPDELAARFLRRADVEHVGECPAPPCRCGQEPQPGPEPEGTPAGRRRRRSGQQASGDAGDTGTGDGAPDA